MGREALGFAALAALVLSAVACAHAPAAPSPCTGAEPIRVSITGSDKLNPDDKGQALATVVRIYQVKGIGKLEGASFDDFLDHGKETLAEDYLSAEEITLNPGEKVTQAPTRNPEAAYVVAVALFRKPTSDTWRSVKKLAPADPQFCHADERADRSPFAAQFVLDGNRIELR
jgi:type VI secretion system VasD/TssJ family lipoprotein